MISIFELQLLQDTDDTGGCALAYMQAGDVVVGGDDWEDGAAVADARSEKRDIMDTALEDFRLVDRGQS